MSNPRDAAPFDAASRAGTATSGAVAPWGHISAALAPIALIGGWTWAARQQPGGFDSVTQTISALQAVGTPDRWIMNVSFAATGLCHMATAASLRTADKPGRLIYAAGGLATIALVFAPLPSMQGSSTAHGAVAGFAFLALAVWPLAARDRTGQIKLLTGAVPIVAAAVLSLLVLAFFMSASLLTDAPTGLIERIAAGAEAFWPLLVVLSAQRRPTGG